MSKWQAPFEKGVASFRSGSYEDAIARFSEALSLGGDKMKICDARAAAYQKVGKTKEALLDSKTVIDLQPSRWQGYARSARLFLQIRKFDAAARMVALALERIPPQQLTRRDEMIKLQDEIHSARDDAAKESARLASLRAYHFGKLPVEIATTMFAMLLDEDPACVVTLAQVCKNWRTTIVGTPTFWDTLVVADKHPKRKIKLWKERSNNRIREIALLRDCTDDPSVCEALRSLSLDNLRILRFGSLALRELILHFDPPLVSAIASAFQGWDVGVPTAGRGDILWSDDITPVFRCRTIVATANGLARINWGLVSETFKDLQSCSLTSCLNEGDFPLFLQFLHNNSSLEDLAVENFLTPPNIPPAGSPPLPISLPHLHSLRLKATNPNDLLPLLSLPALTTLYLATCPRVLDQTLEYLANGTASTLTSLSLSRVAFDPNLLIRVLARANGLQTLELFMLGLNCTNVILEALARPMPPSDPGAQDQCARVYCPELRRLDCSGNVDVRGGPLVRLVKLRLGGASEAPAAGEGTEVDARPVQPLQALIIDDCSQVDSGILPWLRERVPVVSCVYMSKKAAKWKR